MKGIVTRTICGYAGVNLCIVLALAFFFCRSVPLDYRLDIEAKGDVSVVFGRMSDNGVTHYDKALRSPMPCENQNCYREYFAIGDVLDTPAIRISSSSGDSVRIRDFQIVMFGVFCKSLKLESLVSVYSAPGKTDLSYSTAGVDIPLKNGCSELIPNPGRSLSWSSSIRVSRGVLIFVVIVELALLFGLIYIARIVQPVPARHIGNTCLLSLLVTLFLVVVIPLQTYLGNRGDFDFLLGELLSDQIPVCLLVFVCAAACLYMMQMGVGYLGHFAVLAVIIYEYLHCGILAISEPPLTGDVSYYQNRILMARDTLAFLLSLVVFLVGYHWLKPWFKAIVFALAVLLGASLCDIKRDYRTGDDVAAQTALRADGFCSKIEVANSTCWSTNRNVLVFVLDSCSSEVVYDVLVENPELAEKFSGFTDYVDYIGMHPVTDLSTAGMMTGDFYDGPYDKGAMEHYLRTAFNPESVLCQYSAAGYAVYFLPAAYRGGYAWPRQDAEQNTEVKNAVSSFFRRKAGSLQFTLFELLRFRLTPFIGKSAMFAFTYAAMPTHGMIDSESKMYPILAGVETTGQNVFAFFHTNGGHIPYDVDRFGTRIVPPRQGYRGLYDKTYYALSQLGNLFDRLQELGAYDASQIVVLADHGPHAETDTRTGERIVGGVPVRARPFMMVKPLGSRANIQFDYDTPAGGDRLAGLLKTMIAHDLNQSDVSACLKSSNRRFVVPTRQGHEVWSINGSDSQKQVEKLDCSGL